MTTDSAGIAFTVGLLTGEGSFHLTFAKDDRYRYGVAVGIRFQLVMGQFSHDLLKEVRDVFDLGVVHSRPKGYVWTISNRAECTALRNLIKEHLQTGTSPFLVSSKYESFQKWSRAVDVLTPDASLEKDDLIMLANLKDEINSIHSGNHRSASELIAIIEANTTPADT